MIKEIIDENIKKTLEKDSSLLGDRIEYVGSSDVSGCPRRAVLSKLNPPEYDKETLVRFKRGHLAETILAECFLYTNYRWTTQMEFVHPEKEYLKSHADFVFHTKDFAKIGIVEQKSVSFIPDEPYTSWVNQLQFQMGLARLMYPKAEIKGSIFVIDVNSGKYHEFNGYEPVQELFDILVEKAQIIYNKTQSGDTENIPIEPGLLCAYCPFKATCPAFTGDERDIPPEIQEAVEKYVNYLGKEKEVKKKKDTLKQEILGYTGNNFQTKFNGYKLSVKESVSARVDTKALKTEYPEIYETVVKQTPFLSFRVT